MCSCTLVKHHQSQPKNCSNSKAIPQFRRTWKFILDKYNLGEHTSDDGRTQFSLFCNNGYQVPWKWYPLGGSTSQNWSLPLHFKLLEDMIIMFWNKTIRNPDWFRRHWFSMRIRTKWIYSIYCYILWKLHSIAQQQSYKFLFYSFTRLHYLCLLLQNAFWDTISSQHKSPLDASLIK